MTTLHFARADIEGLLVVVYVNNDLCGSGDRPNRVIRMEISEDREIGKAAVIQYVGTDQHEEVTEHPIAGPVYCQI